MSKELTEQWRNGTLEQKYYYVKYFGNGQKPFVEIELKNFLLDLVKVKDRDKIEVLAPVPSYDKFLEYYTGNIHWKKECERLQKQLEEANKIIKDYDTLREGYAYNPGDIYPKKWSLK